MYTGDDFNYAELIAGDEDGHSDALLGIFDAIAPAASAALEALGRGSDNEFFDLLEPTVPLSRHIFKAPTRFYKTGVVFLAYLNGLQDHFVMVGGQQSARSLQHLAELFRLADKARVLADPDVAAARMKRGARRARPRLSDGTDLDGLSINLATVRKQWSFAEAVDGCLRHGITAICPWRDQVAAIGLAEAARIVRANGLQAHRPLPRRLVPGPRRRGPRRARSTTTAAPSTRRPSSAPTAWCWWSAACPAGVQGHARRPRAWSTDGIAALLPHARAAGVPHRDRAAAPDVRGRPRLREHARPGARHLRGARRRRHRRRDRRLPRLVGPRPRRPDRPRRPHGRILAHHICDWLVPTTDLLIDRGMMGDGVIDLPGIRAMIEAAGFHGAAGGRDLLATTGGAAPATRCSPPASSGSAAPADRHSSSDVLGLAGVLGGG